MDSEKNEHMRELLEQGRPVTDEGPYYHHAWWESYKGSVKGKLGGGLLGAGMGAVTGGLAVAGIAAANFALPVAPLLIVAGFAASGLLYGVHEFSEVGKITGAVAASQKTAEKRMKAFEEGKFAEIKEEIDELKAIIKGDPVPQKTAEAASAALKEEQNNYRTEHFQGSKVEGIEKFVFWKIALVGLVVGAVAGAILASGSLATTLLEHLGVTESVIGAAITEAVGEKALGYIASITAFGAVGASFGINRDLFRQLFDQTDLWFRGFVSHGHAHATLSQEIAQEQAANPTKSEAIVPRKETVFYDGQVAYPASDTHHRDKYAAAKQALQAMDPSQMRVH